MDADKMHETVVKELLDGETLKRAGIFGRDVHLLDLIGDEGVDELLDTSDVAVLATGGVTELMDLQSVVEKKCRKLCEDWLETPRGQDYLDQRIQDAEEDARTEAAEARAAAKQEAIA